MVNTADVGASFHRLRNQPEAARRLDSEFLHRLGDGGFPIGTLPPDRDDGSCAQMIEMRSIWEPGELAR